MSRIDIEEILDRYLRNEATPAEITRVDAWLNQHGSGDDKWKQMDAGSREEWLSSLFDDIQATTGTARPKVIQLPQRVLLRRIVAIAAMLAVVFAIYIKWPVVKSSIMPAKLVALNVPLNQKKQVVLADGSKIWVNSASQLKYPLAFNGKTREVYLSGEAYFDIKHDAARPFIIHTGKVFTTVLGTAFNIKTDSVLHTVVVTVTRGKVSVSNGDEQLGVITPNQQISFNTENDEHTQQNVDAIQVVAWQDDIHFNDITFAQAAQQLQQRFKVKINFANDKVKNCRFTGTALNGEKLDQVLKVVCTFNNATYRTNSDGSILIDGPGCN